MIAAVLHDAVTLLHFAVIGRLDVLETRHASRREPRWVEAVRAEVEAGARASLPGCREILSATWLGPPAAPSADDRREIVKLMIALNEGVGPATSHVGEAESIAIAKTLDALFVTDDNAAHDFARLRLGLGRVKDTVDVLREAVAMDELSAFDAAGIASEIRSRGRHLRRCHPASLAKSYVDS